MVKNLPGNAGDLRYMGLISGLGRFPGGGHGNPLQYSRLENPHGQRNLAGYIQSMGHKESDTTQALAQVKRLIKITLYTDFSFPDLSEHITLVINLVSDLNTKKGQLKLDTRKGLNCRMFQVE